MDLDRIREKLEKAGTIEERKLIVESVWRYVEFLRELYREARNEARTYLYALLVVIPLGIAQYTAMLTLHGSKFYPPLLFKLVLTVITIVAICLFLLIANRVKMMIRIEAEIYQLYNTVIDPAMVRLGGWTLLVAAAVLTALAILITILAWLT